MRSQVLRSLVRAAAQGVGPSPICGSSYGMTPAAARWIDTLTGVGSESKFKGLWPPKDPEAEWLKSKQRMDIVLKNNPPPVHKPWEVDHHHDDDHG